MSKKQILRGTFILTLTGFITRLMGFCFRIFLSRNFGEEAVGLYQLIFPVYALCFSFTSAGIEIALSRMVSKYTALNKNKEAQEVLYTSLILSIFISIITMLLLQKYHTKIASDFLKNIESAPLILLLSYVFPFASIHSCIVGYYLGLKSTKVSALSQLIEQCFRIGSVLIFTVIAHLLSININISVAVVGLIIGEISSSFYCLRFINTNSFTRYHPVIKTKHFIYHLQEILKTSIPLSASRICLNFLQSIEAVCIPLKLQLSGSTNEQALSIYGVLTGIALPCILFPSAITNSISTMLLPTVSEIETLGNFASLRKIIYKTICYSVYLGSFCFILFQISGKFIGNFLFKSTMAGNFIITLSWICPFLYANTTLISIINGIGRTKITFTINILSLTFRILSVFYLIPLYGIKGYLQGLLISQTFVFISCVIFLYKKFRA